jgi:hypothetical protein
VTNRICLRTEARTQGNQWQAKTPDGSWIAIPDDKVVNNQDNPTGEPILCALENREKELGWEVICFVPGPWQLGWAATPLVAVFLLADMPVREQIGGH